LNILRNNQELSYNLRNISFKNISRVHFVDLENLVAIKPIKDNSYYKEIIQVYKKYNEIHINKNSDIVFIAANDFIINQLRGYIIDQGLSNHYLCINNGKNGADEFLLKALETFLENNQILSKHEVYIGSGDGIFINALIKLKERKIANKVIGTFNRIHRRIYDYADKITYLDFNSNSKYKYDNITIFIMDYISKFLNFRGSLNNLLEQNIIEVNKEKILANNKQSYFVNLKKNNFLEKNKSDIEKMKPLIKKLYGLETSIAIKSLHRGTVTDEIYL